MNLFQRKHTNQIIKIKLGFIILCILSTSGCSKIFDTYPRGYDYLTTIKVLDNNNNPLQNQEVRLYINIYGENALKDTVSQIIPPNSLFNPTNSPFKTTPIPVKQIQITDKNGIAKFKYTIFHLESQIEFAVFLVRDDVNYISTNMFIHTVPIKRMTLRTIRQDSTIYRQRK